MIGSHVTQYSAYVFVSWWCGLFVIPIKFAGNHERTPLNYRQLSDLQFQYNVSKETELLVQGTNLEMRDSDPEAIFEEDWKPSKTVRAT